MPDFMNRDIGDVSEAFYWRPGDPNSINASYRDSIDAILDSVQAEQPSDVLSAGDFVEGRWGVDVDNTGIFGPVRTIEQKRRAIQRAANTYYSQWKRRFRERGLPVHPAVGDHEMGDYKYPLSARGSHNYRYFYTYRNAYVRAFGPRYYSRLLTSEILLVSVDVFRRAEQSVTIDLGPTQLEWLRSTLASTTADTIIVQGHTPVIGPVLIRHSSGLMYPGGENSAFWQTMVEGGVDLYLAGEVHAFTPLERDGILQLAHGGGFPNGELNYLVGRVYPDRIDLEIKRMHGTLDRSCPALWATDSKRPACGIFYDAGSASEWATTRLVAPSGQ